MNGIVYALGLLLMVLGAVEIVRWGSFRLHQPGETGQMLLLVLPKDGQDCEGLLRAAGERAEWMALRPPCRLVCVCRDPEAREIAARLQERYQNLEICEELEECLETKKAR